MGCAGCCRYFPCLRFTIGIFTFLAFLMGTLSFIAPSWLEREVTATDTELVNYKTYSYGLISSGGMYSGSGDPSSVSDSKYVWKFNDDWVQWTGIEDKAIMLVYAVGMLFILISLWNIAITECVPIKNQSTMLIMIVIWDILAAACIAAAVITYCCTWQKNATLTSFCGGDNVSFKEFAPGSCNLAWGLYGAVASACTIIFVTGLTFIACSQAKTQRRDAAFRHM